jgi:hypothetical protein
MPPNLDPSIALCRQRTPPQIASPVYACRSRPTMGVGLCRARSDSRRSPMNTADSPRSKPGRPNSVRATIKEKREVAKGTLFVRFDLRGEAFDYRPGQYFWVKLLDPPYDDEKGPRRHISAVTSPTERGVIGLCTRLRDSASSARWPSCQWARRSRSSRRKASSSFPRTFRDHSCSSPAGSASPPSDRCFATSKTNGSHIVSR